MPAEHLRVGANIVAVGVVVASRYYPLHHVERVCHLTRLLPIAQNPHRLAFSHSILVGEFHRFEGPHGCAVEAARDSEDGEVEHRVAHLLRRQAWARAHADDLGLVRPHDRLPTPTQYLRGVAPGDMLSMSTTTWWQVIRYPSPRTKKPLPNCCVGRKPPIRTERDNAVVVQLSELGEAEFSKLSQGSCCLDRGILKSE